MAGTYRRSGAPGYDALLTACTHPGRGPDGIGRSRPPGACGTHAFCPPNFRLPLLEVPCARHPSRPRRAGARRALGSAGREHRAGPDGRPPGGGHVTRPRRRRRADRTRQVQTRSSWSSSSSRPAERHAERDGDEPAGRRRVGRGARDARRERHLRLPVRRRRRLQRGHARRWLCRRRPRLPPGPVHLVGRVPAGVAQRLLLLQLVRRPPLGQRLRVGQGRQVRSAASRTRLRPSARSAGTSAGTSPTSRTSTQAAPSSSRR